MRKHFLAQQVGHLQLVSTYAANLIQLQKQLKGVVKENFEFCNTRNRTKIITEAMADFSAIRSYLENNNLAYFMFYQISKKPIKAVICHLPHNTLQKTYLTDW
jgi:hypothetical protein